VTESSRTEERGVERNSRKESGMKKNYIGAGRLLGSINVLGHADQGERCLAASTAERLAKARHRKDGQNLT